MGCWPAVDGTGGSGHEEQVREGELRVDLKRSIPVSGRVIEGNGNQYRARSRYMSKCQAGREGETERRGLGKGRSYKGCQLFFRVNDRSYHRSTSAT